MIRWGKSRRSFSARRVGKFGATAFNPLTLSPTAWYDPSDLSTLFQDSAGTTPVTASGQPVGKMLDKSGNGNHVLQATSTMRPIYTTGGALAWLAFDGIDDFMRSAVLGAALSAPNTVALAAKVDTLATTKAANNYFVSGGAVNNNAISQNSANDTVFLYTGTTTPAVTAALTIAAPYVLNALFNSTSSLMRLSGAASATVDPGSASMDTITLASNPGGAQALTGRIYGVFIKNAALTAPQNASIETYLGAKAGLVL